MDCPRAPKSDRLLAETTGKNGRPRYRAVRSTGAGNAPLAHKIARQMIAKGSVFASKDNMERFLLGFWDPDTSEYLRSRQAEGRTYSRAYLDTCQAGTKRYFLPYFKDRGKQTLAELTAANLEAWRNWLRIDQGASAPNRQPGPYQRLDGPPVGCGRRDATVFHPGARIKQLPHQTTRRGIFELDELGHLFSAGWEDVRAYAACMLAASSGMRLGEVRGLLCRNLHLDQGYLHVVTTTLIPTA